MKTKFLKYIYYSDYIRKLEYENPRVTKEKAECRILHEKSALYRRHRKYVEMYNTKEIILFFYNVPVIWIFVGEMKRKFEGYNSMWILLKIILQSSGMNLFLLVQGTGIGRLLWTMWRTFDVYKLRVILDRMSNCQLLKDNPALWS